MPSRVGTRWSWSSADVVCRLDGRSCASDVRSAIGVPGEVAGGACARRRVRERRLDLGADRLRDRAARAEAAAATAGRSGSARRPAARSASLLRPGTGSGIAESSAIVYGCSGRAKSSSDGRDLDDLAEVHHGDAVGDVADDREVVGDEEVREAELRFSSTSRFSTCDWIETSSADTGSSATTSFGCSTSARAMPMRCRWPPLNWCG